MTTRFISCLLTALLCTPLCAHLSVNQRDFQEPFTFKDCNDDEAATAEYDMVLDIYRRSFIRPDHSKSIWDQTYLQNKPHINAAIQEFYHHKRGMALRSVSFRNKTPLVIHHELLAKGFHVKVIPLPASLKKQTYWLDDGSTSKDPQHPNVVRMYLYVHQDGSIIRMKPRGIPDKAGKHPRRTAHVTKAVLLDLAPHTCTKDRCDYDTSYQNEAFKVSSDHRAIPKAPSPKYGLKLPTTGESRADRHLNRIYKNIAMSLCHKNL